MELAAIARELGFHRAAIIPIEPPRRHALYHSWLAAGHAGAMAYLSEPEHVGPRGDLRALLDSAKSLVVVALAYDRADPDFMNKRSSNQEALDPDFMNKRSSNQEALDPDLMNKRSLNQEALDPDLMNKRSLNQEALVPRDALLRGRIARYARGEDYHLVMRDKLVLLADRLAQELGGPVASRPCVDSAPVLEREWAERGGLGFIAKNTMLIAPGLGSYVVLGELLVAAELAPTAPAEPPKPRCGSCRACLDACPTQAFVDAYTLDARRCISYLTIEHHGSIPVELRTAIGTWVFGCDVCQEVCPFNAGAGEAPDPMLRPRTPEHALPDLIALASKNTNQLRQYIKRTAMRRIPRHVLLRNVAVALGNTGSPDAIPALEALLGHRSDLVREHAQWALERIRAAQT
jgi:epoxyqueuosine reductase